MAQRIAFAAAVAAVLAAAACSSGSTAPTAASSTTTTVPAAATASAAASAPVAVPETAAAAKSAAARFFGLYTAGQYASAWSLLTPADRQAIPQATWVGLHRACRPKSFGLAFRISDVTLTGSTAVVTYSFSGALAALGSATQAFAYTGGRWWLDVNDLSVYQHGSVQADVAAERAAGGCASS